MRKVRLRGVQIREFIIKSIATHPGDIAKVTADRFNISRQAVHKHIKRLLGEGAIIESGETRAKTYSANSLFEWSHTYALTKGLQEDVVWSRDLQANLGPLPDNVRDIWQYGFTEMLNNAIDHSAGTEVRISVEKNAAKTEIKITDNGVGIFTKIQSELGLLDESHAVLELAKGKLTTDPARHSGEGIFFTSRMFDEFIILSGGIHFSHAFGKKEDWILEREKTKPGTRVFMVLSNHTSRVLRKVFDQFSSGEDYGFTKTVVPVRLAQYGDDKLISRSQAKRLLARFERFKIVMLDFEGVQSIGQAFADEVFRVFGLENLGTELIPVNANEQVSQMIRRAKSQ